MSQLEEKKSYGQILKSTSLVGGSQVVSILLGIIRTKFFAIFLGPVGVGLMGVYNSLVQMISAIAGMGIGSSAVRQVAEATATGDKTRISRTVATVRRLSLLFGLSGALLMVLLSTPLARLSFGNANHGSAVAVLSITIFFGVLSAGLAALLQGSRRVADIASLTVLGSFFGTLFSIPVVYVWRESGVVPFLVIVSGMNFLATWWFARRVRFDKIKMTTHDITKESRGLIALGLAFMASGVMTAGVAYLIRVVLTNKFGLEGVGLYQAAYTLSGLYIGIILNAMGMDYYPRLTAVAERNETCNLLIKQQTEIGLMMATPAIIATLLFAPVVINVFYSTKFIPAYGILRWQILGVFLRVISWPVGYLILAKGKALLFFLTESASSLVHLALIMAATKLFGLEGTGIAFFGLYFIYTPTIFFLVRRLSGFSWSNKEFRLFGGIILVIGIAMALPSLTSPTIGLISGVLLTTIITVLCLRRIYFLAGREWFTAIPRQILGRLRSEK